jgi:hypothetical protein
VRDTDVSYFANTPVVIGLVWVPGAAEATGLAHRAAWTRDPLLPRSHDRGTELTNRNRMSAPAASP